MFIDCNAQSKRSNIHPNPSNGKRAPSSECQHTIHTVPSEMRHPFVSFCSSSSIVSARQICICERAKSECELDMHIDKSAWRRRQARSILKTLSLSLFQPPISRPPAHAQHYRVFFTSVAQPSIPSPLLPTSISRCTPSMPFVLSMKAAFDMPPAFARSEGSSSKSGIRKSAIRFASSTEK